MTLTPNQYDILNRFARGAKPSDIAFALGVKLPEVNAALNQVGHDRDRATRLLAGEDTGKPRPAAANEDVFAPTEPASDLAREPDAPTEVGATRTLAQLLDAGDASTDKRTRNIAGRARILVDMLAQRIDEEDAARRAAAEAERLRADTRARLERLQAQVHELEAEIVELGGVASTRKPRGSESATSRAGVDARAVRTWAAAKGMTCKPTGRVPAAVVEAYLAAHGGPRG